MDDKELADRIVALGIGGRWDGTDHLYRLGLTDTLPVDAYAFVRDWRVTGALMEKCSMIFIENIDENVWACRADRCYGNRSREWYMHESQPRAINEACVEALT